MGLIGGVVCFWGITALNALKQMMLWMRLVYTQLVVLLVQFNWCILQ
jgi:hypothetical protein